MPEIAWINRAQREAINLLLFRAQRAVLGSLLEKRACEDPSCIHHHFSSLTPTSSLSTRRYSKAQRLTLAVAIADTMPIKAGR